MFIENAKPEDIFLELEGKTPIITISLVKDKLLNGEESIFMK